VPGSLEKEKKGRRTAGKIFYQTNLLEEEKMNEERRNGFSRGKREKEGDHPINLEKKKIILLLKKEGDGSKTFLDNKLMGKSLVIKGKLAASSGDMTEEGNEIPSPYKKKKKEKGA